MRWAIVAAFIALSAPPPAAANEMLSGVARVVDGDTLALGDTRIRLHGIDAPEEDQTCNGAGGGSWGCGREATRALAGLIAGEEISCEPLARDRYGRTIARCFRNGLDLQAEMVRRGLAWAFVKYSTDYLAQEAEARAARRGIWQSETPTAWDYRRTRWAAYDQAAPEGCPIKGNVNRQGERIYHLPWGRDYAKVKMDLSKGKRWFCSEGAAEAAGWRPAR